MTTLAQTILESEPLNREWCKKLHPVVCARLAPQNPFDQYRAEQFVFDEDVTPIVHSLVRQGKIDEVTMASVCTLPASNTWIEWPVPEHQVKLGYLLSTNLWDDGMVVVKPQVTIVMCMAHNGRGIPIGLLSLPRMPIDLRTEVEMISVYWWYDKNVQNDDVQAEIMAYLWDVFYGVFLIMTPKVCEVRQVTHSEKLQRNRAKHGKLPLVEYKRMSVKVGVGNPRYVGYTSPKGDMYMADRHHRLHRVIGHFRTYVSGRERPKVSFVPEHWRGDAELGIVLHERHVKKS